MTEEFDREMRVNFACVIMIICCIVELFFVLMRFTLTYSAEYKGEGLIITLASSAFTVLALAVTYLIIKGSKAAWWFLMIAFISYIPFSIYYISLDPVYSLELVGVGIYLFLLSTRSVREHCNIHFRRPQKSSE